MCSFSRNIIWPTTSERKKIVNHEDQFECMERMEIEYFPLEFPFRITSVGFQSPYRSAPRIDLKRQGLAFKMHNFIEFAFSLVEGVVLTVSLFSQNSGQTKNWIICANLITHLRIEINFERNIPDVNPRENFIANMICVAVKLQKVFNAYFTKILITLIMQMWNSFVQLLSTTTFSDWLMFEHIKTFICFCFTQASKILLPSKSLKNLFT